MRLAQLARKIGITQGEIVEVLSKNGFQTAENGNTKLEQEEIDLLYNHYKIDPTVEGDDEDTTEIEPDTSEAQDQIKETSDVDEIAESSQKQDPEDTSEHINVEESKTQESQDPEIEPEIIRAKKVKLEGIKVVGKIDLPEPVAPKETEETTKEKKRPVKIERRRKERKKGRKKLSYSEKVKKEELKAERDKKQKERLIKQKKKQHYFENVQPKVAAKPKKKTSKKKFENTTPKRVKPQYKNPLRKFWAWLNGEYDV